MSTMEDVPAGPHQTIPKGAQQAEWGLLYIRELAFCV